MSVIFYHLLLLGLCAPTMCSVMFEEPPVWRETDLLVRVKGWELECGMLILEGGSR